VYGISGPGWLRHARGLALAFVAAGCADSPDPSIEMGASLVIRPKPDSMATVPYTVSNRGSAAAYVAACGQYPSPGTDRLVGGSWEAYFGSGCKGTVDMSPILLAPGQTVSGIWAYDGAGTYRLRVYYGVDVKYPAAASVVGPAFTLE